MRKKAPPPPLPGIIHANIQMPESLHEAMKRIRHARHVREGANVPLCRIYREAAEMYLAATPQRELLEPKRRGALAKRQEPAYADC